MAPLSGQVNSSRLVGPVLGDETVDGPVDHTPKTTISTMATNTSQSSFTSLSSSPLYGFTSFKNSKTEKRRNQRARHQERRRAAAQWEAYRPFHRYEAASDAEYVWQAEVEDLLRMLCKCEGVLSQDPEFVLDSRRCWIGAYRSCRDAALAVLVGAIEVCDGMWSAIMDWAVGGRIPEADQAKARGQLYISDTVSEEQGSGMDEIFGVNKEGEREVVRRKPRKDNSNWWMAYSVSARGKWGGHKDTNANRMSVRKFIYDEMREDRVTKLDIARVIEVAVEWVFVPSEGKVQANKLRNTVAVWERTKEARRPWWSYWWGVSHRPEPEAA